MRAHLVCVFALTTGLASVGCSSAEAPAEGAATAPTAPAATDSPAPAPRADAGAAGTRTCASAPAGTLAKVVHDHAAGGRPKLVLPSEVSGTTSKGIDFQSFDFTLTRVTKLRMKGAVSDGLLDGAAGAQTLPTPPR